MLQDVLDAVAGLDPEVAETAVLLASELAENAVLHAGTGVRGRPRARRGHRSPSPSPTAVPARSRRTSPSRGAATAGPRRHGRGLGPRRPPRHGLGHPPRRRRAARGLVHAHAAPPPHQARPRPRRPTTRRAGSAPSRPGGCCTSRGPRATGCSPSSWSRSSCRRLRDVLDVHAVPSSSTRATAAGPPRSPAPGPRAGRSCSTSRCPSRRRCAASIRLLGPPSRPRRRRGPRGAGRLPRRDGRRDALAARRRPAPPRLDGLPRRGQRAAGPVAVGRAGRRGRPAGRGAAAGALVRGVPRPTRARLRLAALTHADEDELPELRAALDPAARPGPAPRAARPARPGRRAGGGAGRASPRRPTGSRCRCGPAAPPSAPCWWDGPTAGRTRPRTSSWSPTSPGAPPSPCRTPRAPPPTSRCRRRCSRRCCPARCPRRPGSTSPSEYLPASRGSDVGGDFYDVLTVDAGTLARLDRRRLRQGRPRRGPHRSRPRRPARAGARRARARRGGAPAQRGDDGGRRPAAVLHARRRARAARRRGFRRASRSSCSSRATSGRCWSGPTGGVEQVGAFGTAVGLLPQVLVEVTTHRLDARRHAAALHRRRHRATARPGAVRARTAARDRGAHGGRPARQVVAAVRDAVERFSPDPATDDVALLAVRALPE